MAKFFYICRDQGGGKETGTEEAPTQEAAIAKIQAKGLIVVSVIPEGSETYGTSATDRSIKIRLKRKHGRITKEDLMLFCRQLSTLIGAGVTILMSLEIIAKQVASRKLYDVSLDLKKNMEAGLSFHEVLALHPKVFSDLWINLVESGEASGNLGVVLNRLAVYLEKAAVFKSRIISALIYPAILTVAGTGALLFLSISIVPTFAEIFKGFNITLPFLTQVLVGISFFLRKFIFLLVFSIAGIIFVFKKYVQTKSGRKHFEVFQFKLPVFGEFFLALNIEIFSSEMSTLLESGVPILYSLEITERSVNNLTMAEVIRKIQNDVREGKPLRESLERSGFFEPMVVQMISIGEEIGELPQMFKRINAFYQERCDTFLTRFVSMFEPFILVFIGSLIGVMVIGLFLPIFKIANIG
jgi:type IV pilus assembly protein PilC